MFTSYIAINHPDGSGGVDFTGYNWTTSFLYEWEEVGGKIVYDDDDYAVLQPHYSGGSSGWVSSVARWYEDFPNLDLGLMAQSE